MKFSHGQVQGPASAHSIHTFPWAAAFSPFPHYHEPCSCLLLLTCLMHSTGRTLLSKGLCQNLSSSLAAKPDISSQHRMRVIFPSASGYDAITQSNAATCKKQKGCGHIPPLCQLWWRGGCTDHPLLTAWPFKTGDIQTPRDLNQQTAKYSTWEAVPWQPLAGAQRTLLGTVTSSATPQEA